MKDTVYLIKNIEDYGKFIAYCIHHDISVWRTYWDERDKGTIGYYIDWKQKRCFYGRIGYWQGENIDNKVYNIVDPIFSFDKYGNVEITHNKDKENRMCKRFECEYNWIIDNNKINTNESLIVYDEECDTLDDLCELLNQQAQRISELEKQLAEKDKLINEYADEHAMLQYKIADLVVKEIKAEDFAIEQLEKVKYDFLDISNGWWLCFKDGTQYMTHRELEGCVKEIIDKQIKGLKGD